MRLDLRSDSIIREWLVRVFAAAHVVRISIWKDDDVSGLEFNKLPIHQLDESTAFDDQVIEHKVFRLRSDFRRHDVNVSSRSGFCRRGLFGPRRSEIFHMPAKPCLGRDKAELDSSGTR